MNEGYRGASGRALYVVRSSVSCPSRSRIQASPRRRPGTFGSGAASNKIDYILLSPALFQAVRAGGIFRMGVWGGKNGDLFPHYPEITKPGEAASDHAAIWVDLRI